MYTFLVNFLGSTELPTSTDAHIEDYAAKCLAVPDWPSPPVTSKVFSDSDALTSFSDFEGELTLPAVRAKLEKNGYIMYATEAEAAEKAADMVRRCEAAIAKTRSKTLSAA